ncbi:MafI family immunity protein [Providencia stuartii]
MDKFKINNSSKMKTNKKIMELGEKLKDRLPLERVMFAVEYVNYCESPLALETLRDYIEEYDVVITHDEYNSFIEIAEELNIQLDTKDLIVR